MVEIEQESKKKRNMEFEHSAGPVKVLIVDDSRMIRKAIRGILEDSGQLEVVGEAGNGVEALDLTPELNPDVVTLDVNMPVMDGLTTLKHMMIKYPRPAVMISTLTREGSSITFDALKYGAVDFVLKPSQVNGKQLAEQRESLVRKVILASRVEASAIRYMRSTPPNLEACLGGKADLKHVFAVGAAEGGYSSLLKVVPSLRPDLPAAVVVALNIESEYVDAFALYLHAHSMIVVKRAKDGEPLLGGVCYLASAKEYIALEKNRGGCFLRFGSALSAGGKTAINRLMVSAAENFGGYSVGIVLSGATRDGLEGMKEIKSRGGVCVVQDPRTCLCKEMPTSVLGGFKVDLVIPDRDMAAELNGVF